MLFKYSLIYRQHKDYINVFMRVLDYSKHYDGNKQHYIFEGINVEKITNHNDITHHYLQCIFSNVYDMKKIYQYNQTKLITEKQY